MSSVYETFLVRVRSWWKAHWVNVIHTGRKEVGVSGANGRKRPDFTISDVMLSDRISLILRTKNASERTPLGLRFWHELGFERQLCIHEIGLAVKHSKGITGSSLLILPVIREDCLFLLSSVLGACLLPTLSWILQGPVCHLIARSTCRAIVDGNF